MPVRIVSDGVLTRSVRDTAAFLREAEWVYRELRLPPIGDVTRPGRKRLRIAVHTAGVGRAASPGGRRAHAQDRPAARGARPPGRGGATPGAGDRARRLPPLLGDARDGHRPHRTPLGRPDLGPGPARQPHPRPRPALPPQPAPAPRRDPPAASAAGASPRSSTGTYDVVLTPTLAHETPLVGHLDPTAPYDVVMDRILDWVAFTPLAERDRRPGRLAAPRDHRRGASRRG